MDRLIEDKQNILADDALEALSDIQKNLPYGIATTIGGALGKLKKLEDAEIDGLLVKLPCRSGEQAYYAFNDMSTWKYEKCIFIATGTSDHIIEIEYTLDGDKVCSLKRWIYVFATEQEAADFAQRKNDERVFIPINGKRG